MKKFFSFALSVCLLLAFCQVALAENIELVSKKTGDKDFSRVFRVTYDSKSVKSKKDYFTVRAKATTELKFEHRQGEVREQTLVSEFLYAFKKNERKYKILAESYSESFKQAGKQSGESYSQSSSSSSAFAMSESLAEDWKALPSDPEDYLNKLYGKLADR